MKLSQSVIKSFTKLNHFYYAAGAAIVLAFSGTSYAQNTSYNANTIPINGWDCSAFGLNALSSNTSSGVFNAATGVNALRSNTTGHRNTATGFSALDDNTTGSYNTGTGCDVLSFNTSGESNTATGFAAMKENTTGRMNVATGVSALSSNTTGGYNAACGANALRSNTTGNYNAAMGYYALFSNTTGNSNVAIGNEAMRYNTAASFNTAVGYYALRMNTGSYNTANGYLALTANTSGNWNMANGYQALYSNTTGSENAGAGSNALRSNTSGSYNAAMGTNALYYNTTGYKNTASGYRALFNNTSGNYNTADGFQALYSNTTGTHNTASGYYALYSNTTGKCNTGLGFYANVLAGNLENATAIGCEAIVNDSNKIRLGNANVTQVEGATYITVPSDGRFKTNIKEDDVKGLEFIQKLRPVVYNFDTRKFTEFLTKNMQDSIRQTYLDQDFSASTNIRQSGFIAQEVEKAAKEVDYKFSGVHAPKNDNDNYSLAYSAFVVPLVKAVQEQQQMIEGQEQKMKDQQQVIELLRQQVEALQQNKTTGLNDGLSFSGASMEQNVPNPFSRETVIRFNLPQQVSNAFMTVYDLSGKEIKTLPLQQRGASSVTLSAEQLQAGMYLYSITADGKIVDTKKMVVAGK